MLEDKRIDWILHRGGLTALSMEIIIDTALALSRDGGTRKQ